MCDRPALEGASRGHGGLVMCRCSSTLAHAPSVNLRSGRTGPTAQSSGRAKKRGKSKPRVVKREAAAAGPLADEPVSTEGAATATSEEAGDDGADDGTAAPPAERPERQPDGTAAPPAERPDKPPALKRQRLAPAVAARAQSSDEGLHDSDYDAPTARMQTLDDSDDSNAGDPVPSGTGKGRKPAGASKSTADRAVTQPEKLKKKGSKRKERGSSEEAAEGAQPDGATCRHVCADLVLAQRAPLPPVLSADLLQVHPRRGASLSNTNKWGTQRGP